MTFLFLQWLEDPAAMVTGMFELLEEGIISFTQYLDFCFAINLCVAA